LKVLVRTLGPAATPEEIGAQLENSIKLVDIARERELKKQWELDQERKESEEKKEQELKSE
jgi:hypothetical protein